MLAAIGILEAIAVLSVTFGQSFGDGIIVAPISSALTVVTVGLAMIFSKEKITKLQGVGSNKNNGIEKLGSMTIASKAIKVTPAICDQRKVLECPIFSDALFAKKSDVPHPTIPPIPARILVKTLSIGIIVTDSN